jgi:hypothetical protein
VKRKARAIMDMRQWLKFSSKVASCRDATRADVVAIHQHVLKSTTRAGLVALVYLVCFVCVVEQNKPENPDEPDRPDRSRIAFGLKAGVF